jgi:hypothetical protein
MQGTGNAPVRGIFNYTYQALEIPQLSAFTIIFTRLCKGFYRGLFMQIKGSIYITSPINIGLQWMMPLLGGM